MHDLLKMTLDHPTASRVRGLSPKDPGGQGVIQFRGDPLPPCAKPFSSALSDHFTSSDKGIPGICRYSDRGSTKVTHPRTIKMGLGIPGI